MANDGVTVSLFELMQLFPNEDAAREYLEGRRWKDGVYCPKCGGMDRIGKRKNHYYRCHPCGIDFTIRTGSIFERSHVPLHKWIFAAYMMVTERKGISSLQLSKQIGITQKSAWFLLGRLREACGGNLEMLRGIVEIDELFVGAKERFKHKNKKLGLRSGSAGKAVVLGMRERGGRTVLKHVPDAHALTLSKEIANHVHPQAEIHTDESNAYHVAEKFYTHRSVNHSKGEYFKAGIGTNSIESTFAVLRRGLHGVYHSASKKHLHRYVAEFQFRLNEGACDRHTLLRMNSLVDRAVGRRLTYKDLTK